MTGGLGVEEDTVAYLLRHTQLLPRHLIEILNNVFTAPVPDSQPVGGHRRRPCGSARRPASG